jgi:anti-anti-sigma factor
MAHRVVLGGEYDLSRKEEVSSLFDSLSTDAPAVVDMSAVTYVDSTFLRLLADLHCRFKDSSVTLTGVSERIKRILHIVRFDQLFRLA